MWVIQNINNADQFWENGWVRRADAAIYSDAEQKSTDLPMGGEWISTTATKIGIREIRIRRAEGLHSETKKHFVLKSFAAADDRLRTMALTAPKDGSYNKTDFWIEYQDGFTYNGRFDLQYHHTAGANLLKQHVGEFQGYLCGRYVPPYIVNAVRDFGEDRRIREGHNHAMKMYAADGTAKMAERFLETYKLED